MTDEMMSLRALLEKSADVELVREMVGFAAQRAGAKVKSIGSWQPVVDYRIVAASRSLRSRISQARSSRRQAPRTSRPSCRRW